MCICVPSGQYKTVVKHPKFLRGTWVLTFINGHYQASYNGRPGRCRGTGKYKFKLTMGKLKFTKISDTKSCAGRAAVLSHTFTEVS